MDRLVAFQPLNEIINLHLYFNFSFYICFVSTVIEAINKMFSHNTQVWPVLFFSGIAKWTHAIEDERPME